MTDLAKELESERFPSAAELEAEKHEPSKKGLINPDNLVPGQLVKVRHYGRVLRGIWRFEGWTSERLLGLRIVGHAAGRYLDPAVTQLVDQHARWPR